MARFLVLLSLLPVVVSDCGVEKQLGPGSWWYYVTKPGISNGAGLPACSQLFCYSSDYNSDYIVAPQDVSKIVLNSGQFLETVSDVLLNWYSEGCFINPVVYQFAFFPVPDTSKTTQQYYKTISFNCLWFTQVDCVSRTCPEGTYADKYLNITNSYVTNKVSCVPCAPGSLNTCLSCDPAKGGCTCNWPIPTGPNEPYGPKYNVILQAAPPVFNCYPCALLLGFFQYQFHSNDPDQTKHSLVNSDNHYCPGNLNGNDGIPRNCPTGTVHSTDYTTCVCPPGYYLTNPGDLSFQCTACPIGYSCLNNIQTLCPDHTYQDQVASSTCLQCISVLSAGAKGIPVGGTCQQGFFPRQCVGNNSYYKSSFPTCTPCNSCQRPYTQTVAGQVPCYFN